MQQGNNSAKAPDGTSAEISKAQESLNLLVTRGHGPLIDSADPSGVHLNAVLRDDEPRESNDGGMELVLF